MARAVVPISRSVTSAARAVTPVGGGAASPYQSLVADYSRQAEEARAANLQRYNEAMAIYDKIIAQSAPGGPTERAYLGELETRKKRDVGREALESIGRGTFNVGGQGIAGLSRQWESSVGEPARLRLEDLLQQRQSQAMLGKAGFIERREDVYPDYGNLMSASVAEGATGGYTYGSGIPGSQAAKMWEEGLGPVTFAGSAQTGGRGYSYKGPQYDDLMKEQQKKTAATAAPTFAPFTEEEKARPTPTPDDLSNYTGEIEVGNTRYRVNKGTVTKVRSRRTGKWISVGYPKPVSQYFGPDESISLKATS